MNIKRVIWKEKSVPYFFPYFGEPGVVIIPRLRNL